MYLIKYILLGIIQGITEPLPISSSAHIIIFKNLFNTHMFNDFNFEIFANFGSLIAILLIYYKDIYKLIKNSFKYIIKKDDNNDFKYIIKLIISTMPVGFIGFIFKDKIEAISSLKLIGIALLLTSISLLLVKNTNGYKKDNDIKIIDAIIIGLFEMIALIPGLSRSGMVLVGSLLCKFDNNTAFKYTFLLYIPISIASFILSIFDIGLSSNLLIPYLIGSLSSFIVTYYTFNWFKSYVNKGNLWKFAIYCIILSIFVLYYFR